MFAESAGDFGGNALLLAICVLLLLLGAWNVWLVRRLRQARSLEEELRAVVGQRLGDRLDPHDPAFVTALDEGLRARLPDVVQREVESPTSPLHLALTQKLARQVEQPDDQALDATVREALLGRVGAILAGPGDFAPLFAAIDEKLGEHVVARSRDASPAMVEVIDAGLQCRLGALFESPDDFAGLFEEIDARLGEGIRARIEVADESRVNALVAERLLARMQGMFDDPDEHEELFDSVDEKLGERILRSAGKMPEETTRRMDAVIRDALVAEVEYIFDKPDSYESIVETIDELLGHRITRLLSLPSPELQEGLEGPIREGLAGRLKGLFANPDDHAGLLQELDELLGSRVERRLREELARGDDGLIEQLFVEAIRERVRGRLDSRRESLDQTIDTRDASQNGEGGA